MAAAVAPLAPATAVADMTTPHASGSHARSHHRPPATDVAAGNRSGRIATVTSAAIGAILVGFLLLGARGGRRHRTRSRPLTPMRPIAVPPRPG